MYYSMTIRFFKQFILLFLVHQVAISLFRLIASLVRNPSLAAPVGLFSLIVMFLFGGFIIPKSKGAISDFTRNFFNNTCPPLVNLISTFLLQLLYLGGWSGAFGFPLWYMQKLVLQEMNSMLQGGKR